MTHPEPESGSPQRTAAYLRELLLRQGRYRRKWEQYSERSRRGQVNQLAVAEVLAHYLWDHPRSAGDGDVLARQLKDTTARALSGTLLSRSTLNLFMDAFDLSDFERDQLRKLWEGDISVRFLQGSSAMRPDTIAEVKAVLGPPGHKTVSLHDHMSVGVDRRPLRTRTLQVVEAIRPDLDRIPYIYDMSALTVTAGMGCVGLIEAPVQVADGVYASHMRLANTLQVGDTQTLEYWTTYHYPDDYPGPDDREYRRVVMRRVENIGIRVEFSPEMLPANVWWAIWDNMDGAIVEERLVDLDHEFAVQRFLSLAERVVVGFHWEW